jgi:tRNA A37 threonylcarbamoyladenosine dehydratase
MRSCPNISENEEIPEYKIRTAQTFGKGTTEKLSSLSIGVVGVSGTGIPVVEQLHRLSVGELVLVDGARVEEKNVGRIYNSTL